MPAVPGRDGCIRLKLQALPLWLPGIALLCCSNRALSKVVRKVCRFCWHHIKENLNRRCPACRREYSDEAVQFKAINKEECVVLAHCYCPVMSHLRSFLPLLSSFQPQATYPTEEAEGTRAKGA